MLLPVALVALLVSQGGVDAQFGDAQFGITMPKFDLPDFGKMFDNDIMDAITSGMLATGAPRNGTSIIDKLHQGSLLTEWNRNMQGFVPELLLTFPLAARTDEFFFEDVTPPAFIRGAFFASADSETSDVDFQVTDPDGEVVFEQNGKPESLFSVTAKKKGLYTFIVSNHKWMEQKTVTFAVGKGTESDGAMQAEHLSDVDSQAKALEKKLRDIQTESTYLWIRQQAGQKGVESIHRRVFWFCVLQLLILMGISGFQVFYIKGLLSDRRVI